MNAKNKLRDAHQKKIKNLRDTLLGGARIWGYYGSGGLEVYCVAINFLWLEKATVMNRKIEDEGGHVIEKAKEGGGDEEEVEEEGGIEIEEVEDGRGH